MCAWHRHQQQIENIERSTLLGAIHKRRATKMWNDVKYLFFPWLAFASSIFSLFFSSFFWCVGRFCLCSKNGIIKRNRRRSREKFSCYKFAVSAMFRDRGLSMLHTKYFHYRMLAFFIGGVRMNFLIYAGMLCVLFASYFVVAVVVCRLLMTVFNFIKMMIFFLSWLFMNSWDESERIWQKRI